jgi:biopolymer transport protein ExbB/TolQ
MGETNGISMLITEALTGDPVIRAFIFTMAALSAAEIYSIHKGARKDLKSYIVSIGVLGTFCGIFVGLGNFDTSDVIGSIPQLLDGLKIAFLTSIVGMFFAVSLGVVETLWFTEGENADATPIEVIAHKLDKLDNLEVIVQHNAASVKQLSDLRKDFKEEHKAIQATVAKNFESMNATVTEALETMSKGATSEVIKALDQVIRDFNNQLTEQFGENFKALNSAVIKLVEWQQNYMEHLEVSEKRLKSLEDMMQDSAKTITMIADTNADMHRMYDEVGRQITTYDREVRALHKELESFAEIGERAVTGFNILNDGFGRIVNDIDGLSQRISSGLNTQSETVEMLTEKLRAELPKSLGELEKTLASLTEKFGRDYEAFLNKCNGLLPR